MRCLTTAAGAASPVSRRGLATSEKRDRPDQTVVAAAGGLRIADAAWATAEASRSASTSPAVGTGKARAGRTARGADRPGEGRTADRAAGGSTRASDRNPIFRVALNATGRSPPSDPAHSGPTRADDTPPRARQVHRSDAAAGEFAGETCAPALPRRTGPSGRTASVVRARRPRWPLVPSDAVAALANHAASRQQLGRRSDETTRARGGSPSWWHRHTDHWRWSPGSNSPGRVELQSSGDRPRDRLPVRRDQGIDRNAPDVSPVRRQHDVQAAPAGGACRTARLPPGYRWNTSAGVTARARVANSENCCPARCWNDCFGQVDASRSATSSASRPRAGSWAGRQRSAHQSGTGAPAVTDRHTSVANRSPSRRSGAVTCAYRPRWAAWRVSAADTVHREPRR